MQAPNTALVPVIYLSDQPPLLRPPKRGSSKPARSAYDRRNLHRIHHRRIGAESGPMSPVRGFILQASYRVVTREGGIRIPVVHIHGRLENGGTFLVRDDRPRPHFYIRASDAARARALRVPPPLPVDKRTFDDEAVRRIEVETPPEVPGVRDRLQAADIDTFEADVRFAMRYLIERGIKGGCEIEGDAQPGSGQ